MAKKIQGNPNENEAPSKSAKKRESAARQKIGEELLTISPALRKALTLPEDLENALALHASLTDKEAARRQRQYIGRLMREVNLAELLQVLDEKAASGEFPKQGDLKAYRQLKHILSYL